MLLDTQNDLSRVLRSWTCGSEGFAQRVQGNGWQAICPRRISNEKNSDAPKGENPSPLPCLPSVGTEADSPLACVAAKRRETFKPANTTTKRNTEKSVSV